MRYPGTVAYLADQAVVGGDTVLRPAYIEVDAAGLVTRTDRGLPPPAERADIVHDLGARLLVPGFVNAHSHAFQRAIRGPSNRRSDKNETSFWTWRAAMYERASTLDPDEFESITRRCFEEMIDAGITCVGEFHYIHHRPDGTPYEDPNELSHRVIAAAAQTGIRLQLLEVLYQRASAGQPPLREQRRFCDHDVTAYLERVDVLRTEFVASDPLLGVGLAPHSIRAVSLADLGALAAYAGDHQLMVHAHVSEQPAENDACLTEHGCTPTAAFERAGLLERARSFTAVHAIHIDDADRVRLGRQHVCACPTTEADLGDGIILGSALAATGTHLALGSDSNAVIDLVQEARALEMHERLATLGRLRLCTGRDSLGLALLEIATRGGARSLGRDDLGTLEVGKPFDAAAVDLGHTMFRDVDPELALDVWMTHGHAEPIDRVFVRGKRLR